ncbi:MAG TPA: transposase [Anaerolineales bacterium]|nr:transposase [Anaerolineales bacterium]
MKFNSQIHHRRSIRVQEYDYAQGGAYFVTIVASEREPLFGKIENEEMKLSPLGEIAHAEWFKTAELRSKVKLWEDEFVVMPNHVHGVIWIEEDDNVGARRRRAPTERFGKPISGSLPTIIRAYKSAVTYAVNEMRGTRGAPVWQRNYYEHVIRNQNDLENIYKYIQHNPIQWAEDEENPEWGDRH